MQYPFDHQICKKATLDNLSQRLLTEYLLEAEPELAKLSDSLSLLEICQKLDLVDQDEKKPNNYIPRNIAILLFSENPQEFFPDFYIEVTDHSRNLRTTEPEIHVFKGNLLDMLANAMDYIRLHVIHETQTSLVTRQENSDYKAVFNYPFTAIREAMVNAVYHCDFEENTQIKVKVFPNYVEIVNTPHADSELFELLIDEVFDDGKQYYLNPRNVRLKEFLKKLHIVEGEGKGIQTIFKSLKEHGCPEPEFTTNKFRNQTQVVISARKKPAGRFSLLKRKLFGNKD